MATIRFNSPDSDYSNTTLYSQTDDDSYGGIATMIRVVHIIVSKSPNFVLKEIPYKPDAKLYHKRYNKT